MRRSSVIALALLLNGARLVAGQPPPATPDTGAAAAQVQTDEWAVAVDGVLFGTFSHQGGRRGATEFRSQNWFMATASRRVGPGSLGVTGMMSAEPFTAPGMGYAQIFQEGEGYRGFQITDHQHPHDLVMQLSVAWSVPLGRGASMTIAGGPVGEPALGPIPFMHRASSAENPTAPLSHHIFDSTHLTHGVILARLDRGIVSIEGSVFRGRESDERRYDFDMGALDSWSARVWLRPTPGWLIQASHGFLEEPEPLEPGDQRRSSVSGSWSRRGAEGFTAVTAALGRNRRQFSTVDSVLVEGTHKVGRSSIFGRFERTEVETEILLFPQVLHIPHPGELVDPIHAFTLGAVRDVAAVRGLAVGVGGDLTLYRVPPLLQNTHGERPVSFHLFVRVAPSQLARRMWDTTMAQHAGGHRHH